MSQLISHVEPRSEDGLTSDVFRHAFRNHAAGVAVVTADDGSGPVGLTATSVFSVSADPAILVFSVSDSSSSASVLSRAESIVVHLLGADQIGIARLCATSGIDRFADTEMWDRLSTGEPYFIASPVLIRARVLSRSKAGSSTIFAAHALEAWFSEAESKPLVYHNRTWHALGDHSQLDLT